VRFLDMVSSFLKDPSGLYTVQFLGSTAADHNRLIHLINHILRAIELRCSTATPAGRAEIASSRRRVSPDPIPKGKEVNQMIDDFFDLGWKPWLFSEA